MCGEAVPRRGPRVVTRAPPFVRACISMRVVDCSGNQASSVLFRRGRAIRAWLLETVAEQVRHADLLLEPEQLRGPFEPESASLGAAEQME